MGPVWTCYTFQPCSLVHLSYYTHSLALDAQALDERLKSFWELESFGILPVPNAKSSVHQNSVCLIDGRYQVELPWKESHPSLPDSFSLCLKRLRRLTHRLQQNPAVLGEYDATIKNQIQQGIVEPVQEDMDESQGKVHYLPHHAVIRHDKETTKIRVVCDASARSDGPSLNDCLHSGPKFDRKILDILLRFRIHRVAVTVDIEKAFLIISMAQRDRDVLRFLWYDNVNPTSSSCVSLEWWSV